MSDKARRSMALTAWALLLVAQVALARLLVESGAGPAYVLTAAFMFMLMDLGAFVATLMVLDT